MGWGVRRRLAAAMAAAAVAVAVHPNLSLASPPAADPAGCAVVAALVESGDLDDVTTVAAALDGSVDPNPKLDAARTCPEAVGQSKAQRDAAENLVSQAKATADATTKALLASTAQALDGDNAEAAALVTSTTEKPELCAAAQQATARGEFARAQAVFDALKDVEAAKKCRQAGLTVLAEAKQSDPATVVTNSVSKDLLPTLLLLLVAFVLGAWLTSWWRISIRRARLVVLGWTALLAALGVGLVRARASAVAPSSATAQADDRWSAVTPWLAVAAVLAAVLGFVVANVQRDRLPVTIEVTGEDKAAFAARVVDEISALGGDGSDGSFVPKGTDVSDSGLAAALAGGSSTALVKVLLSVWNLLRLRVSDTVAVVLTAEKGSPSSAVVSVRSGQRVGTSAAVDGRLFCLDVAKPTTAELASTQRDVATAVASVVLLSRVGRRADLAARLYGACDPRSLALCVVAARRLEAEELTAARELYEAAIDRESDNLMARYGAIAARLRAYPDQDTTRHLVAALTTLEAKLIPDTAREGRWATLRSKVTRHRPPATRAGTADEGSAVDKAGAAAGGGQGASPPSPQTTRPLVWRLCWLRAAARANAVLSGADGWDDLVTEGARAMFCDVKKDLDWLEALDPGLVPAADRSLADTLVRNAQLAQRVVQRIGPPPPRPTPQQPVQQQVQRPAQPPGQPTPLSALEPDDLVKRVFVDDRSVQFTAACTLAVDYAAAVHAGRRAEATRLSEACLGLVESAGGQASWRATLLDDPFLKLVAGTDSFATLRREWKPTTPYDGVDCFGKLTGVVAGAYAEPADLATALADPDRVKELAGRTGAVPLPVREWAGAAAWLHRGQKAEHINLYQAAGLPDAAAARAPTKRAVKRRLRGAMTFVGATDLPDKATRAAMRRT